MGGTVTCSPATQCVNIIGSYYCGCNLGYRQSSICIQCIEDNNGTGDANADACVPEITAANLNSCCSDIDECEEGYYYTAWGKYRVRCPVDSVCQVCLRQISRSLRFLSNLCYTVLLTYKGH